MKQWIINNRLYFIGALTGALGGFLYWKFIGCLDGTCSITSSPVNSTLYFGFFGALIFGSFKKRAGTEK
jgi:hypothetical protein